METRLDATAKFVGEITTEDDLLIEGSVEGHVRSKAQVTVAPGGRVTGQLRARDVDVAGIVEGNIWASHNVHLGATGRIQGDVSAIHLRVDDGGVMQGRVLTEMPAIGPANR